MKIIDSHVHVFKTLAGFGAKGELRAIGNGKAIWADGTIIDMIPKNYGDTTFEIDSLLSIMNENNVEKAVILQGGFYGFQNHYVKEAIDKYPNRFTGAVTFDPFCKNAKKLATLYLKEWNFKIVKFELSTGAGLMSCHSSFKIDNKMMMQYYQMINDSNATLVLDIGSPLMDSFQPEAVAQIAKNFKEMNIVICHLGAPTIKDFEHLKEMLNILKLDNVYFDLSAIPWNVYPEVYPYPTAKKFILLAKEIVGIDKLLWGSDAPSPLTRDSYKHLWNYIEQIFDEEDMGKILYKNSSKVYFRN